MKVEDMIRSIRHRSDALEQIEGALWGERVDPRLSEADRQKLVAAKLAIVKERASRAR